MALNRIRQAGSQSVGFPACCIVSRTADAASNEGVLYHLVVPAGGDLQAVKSADNIVNVIPPNRVYNFLTVEELDAFRLEILKRPTVIHFRVDYVGCPLAQRIHHSFTCGVIQKSENWILMIHQFHPKILSRIQMGFDRARSLIFSGKPFFLNLDFNEALSRNFSNIWMRYEGAKEEREVNVTIEGAGVVISYGNMSLLAGLTTELNFKFEDLSTPDFTVRRPGDAVTIVGATAQPERADEYNLQKQLPGWEFSLDPDSELNTAARTRFSYATASRMIKKKKVPTATLR